MIVCLLYLKFSDLLPETHFFIWPTKFCHSIQGDYFWDNKQYTRFRPMEFSIKLDTVKSGWSIVYIEGLHIIIYK